MSRSLRVAVDGLMSRPDRLQAQFPTVGGGLLVGLRADSPMLIPAGSDDHSFLSGSRVCGKRRVPKGSSRGHGPPPRASSVADAMAVRPPLTRSTSRSLPVGLLGSMTSSASKATSGATKRGDGHLAGRQRYCTHRKGMSCSSTMDRMASRYCGSRRTRSAPTAGHDVRHPQHWFLRRSLDVDPQFGWDQLLAADGVDEPLVAFVQARVTLLQEDPGNPHVREQHGQRSMHTARARSCFFFASGYR